MACRAALHLFGPLDAERAADLRRLVDSKPKAYTVLRRVLDRFQPA